MIVNKMTIGTPIPEGHMPSLLSCETPSHLSPLAGRANVAPSVTQVTISAQALDAGMLLHIFTDSLEISIFKFPALGSECGTLVGRIITLWMNE